MEFALKKDIAAPVDMVFAALTDFPAYERQVLRRGAELRRLDSPPVQDAGASWDAAFQYRGKLRRLKLTITEFDAPTRLAATGESAPVLFNANVELMEIGPGQTRLKAKLSLTPRTFAARLMVQSLKLARAATQRRMDARLAQFAADIEARHTRATPPR